MDKKSNSSIGAGNSRSAAIRTKVLRAMRAIRREIAANASHGDQSNSITAKEVATRAGIHPTTFHTRKQRTLGARVKTWVRLLNTRAAQEEVVPATRAPTEIRPNELKIGRTHCSDWASQPRPLTSTQRRAIQSSMSSPPSPVGKPARTRSIPLTNFSAATAAIDPSVRPGRSDSTREQSCSRSKNFSNARGSSWNTVWLTLSPQA